MKYYGMYLAALLAILLAGCGESLEDTYKDYSGEGMSIRYTGRPTNITATPGWERVLVEWTNSVDPLISQLKVVWRYDEEADSVLLPAGTTTYSIETINGQPLGDRSFEITLTSVGSDGSESLATTVYGRPYTTQHEEVLAYNRLISTIYKIHDHVVLTFLDWQEGINAAHLTYTKKDGTLGYTELTPELVAQKYYLMEDELDNSKPITVYRTAKLPTCVDEIEFEPMEFDNTRVFNSDFQEDLRRQYGFDEIPEQWIEQQKVLYLDGISYNTLIDLLNFPNLNKVVMGSRRYFPESEADDAEYAQNAVLDPISSNFALEVLNKLNGLTVERYNKHYPQLQAAGFFQEMGATKEPKVKLIDLTGHTFRMSPADIRGFDSHLNHLTDGDPATFWEPRRTNEANQYQLSIDLGEKKAMKGVRIVQRKWENAQEHMVAPTKVRVLLSEDGVNWGYPTYLEEIPIGAANGEVCYVDFAAAFAARHVMLIVSSGYYFDLNFTSLAEISIY